LKQVIHYNHVENSQYKRQGYEFFLNGGNSSLWQQNLRKILPRFDSMSSQKLSQNQLNENSEEQIHEIEQIAVEQQGLDQDLA